MKIEKSPLKQAKLEAIFEIPSQGVNRLRGNAEEELQNYGKWSLGKFNRDTSKCYAYRHLTGQT